jgi:hypothetical protein
MAKKDLSKFTRLGNYLFNMEAFLDKCDEQPDGCILWTGGRHRQGYSMVCGYRVTDNKRIMQVGHRVSMMFKLNRELARTENVIHTCSNNLCVAPAHLIVGDTFKRAEVMMTKGHTWHYHRKNLPPAKQLGREYKWTEEQIRYARENSTRHIATRFNITRIEAGKMRYECRKCYKWLE